MATIIDNTWTELFSGVGIGTFRVVASGIESSPRVLITERSANNYFGDALLQSNVKDLVSVSTLGNISWTENLQEGTHCSMQTRTGPDSGQADDYATWEAWKPSPQIDVDNMDVVSGLVYSSSDETYLTATQEETIKVEGTGSLKLAGILAGSSLNGQYAQRVDLDSIPLSGVDYLTAKVRADLTGTYMRVIIANSNVYADPVSTSGLTYDINIDNENQWQNVFWDITDIAEADRDAITYMGFKVTDGSSTFNFYVDDVKGGKFLTTNTGQAIQSTPQRYLQYRAIMTTTR